MAPFNRDELWVSPRLDYRLMQNGSCTLYYRQEVLDETVAWLTERDYTIYTLDCRDW